MSFYCGRKAGPALLLNIEHKNIVAGKTTTTVSHNVKNAWLAGWYIQHKETMQIIHTTKVNNNTQVKGGSLPLATG